MMNKDFDLLMQSLEQAKEHVKGKKRQAHVTTWEIKPVSHFTARDIKRIRHKIELSQPLFAELIGVSVKTVRSWEQGLSHPTGGSLRLLEAFDKKKDRCLALYKDIKVITASVR
jgi:putative transcriptional regulator